MAIRYLFIVNKIAWIQFLPPSYMEQMHWFENYNLLSLLRPRYIWLNIKTVIDTPKDWEFGLGTLATIFVICACNCLFSKWWSTKVVYTQFYLLFLQLYIEGLCHGNLLEEEAHRLSEIFKSNFFVQPLPYDFRHKEIVMCLPSSADLVRYVKVKNKLETNSVVEVSKKQLE